MIQEFVDKVIAGKDALMALFLKDEPQNYLEVVEAVVATIGGDLDKDRIHEIDDGEYQGTLAYLIAKKGYQPDGYWFTKVYYGSCSGCDTLQAILDEPDAIVRAKDYWTLALHIVQNMIGPL